MVPKLKLLPCNRWNVLTWQSVIVTFWPFAKSVTMYEMHCMICAWHRSCLSPVQQNVCCQFLSGKPILPILLPSPKSLGGCYVDPERSPILDSVRLVALPVSSKSLELKISYLLGYSTAVQYFLDISTTSGHGKKIVTGR